MTEQDALAALAPTRRSDKYRFFTDQWATWPTRDGLMTMQGVFTAAQLEALAWWMRNKLPTD